MCHTTSRRHRRQRRSDHTNNACSANANNTGSTNSCKRWTVSQQSRQNLDVANSGAPAATKCLHDSLMMLPESPSSDCSEVKRCARYTL